MRLEEFDKYKYYLASVQCPEADAEFIDNTFKEIRGYDCSRLREDFCGTFALCCEWVKLSDNKTAHGVDLDPEPLEYGERNYYSKLSQNQQKRVTKDLEDVLSPQSPKAQAVCALNFSYFIFKERALLKQYFSKVYESLEDDGVFFLDCFGGSECQQPIVEETEFTDEGFSYFWDQDNFDPINNHAQFYIHIQRKGEKKRERVFSYDWRMWSIPELRDIMTEVGFSKTWVYWEGDDGDGGGDGTYTREDKVEDCESWVSYIVGVK